MLKRLKNIIHNKFSNDLLWNLGSFFLTAITGLLINIAITSCYSFEALGYFNLVYAIYLFLSQISVWGIHLSVQKYIPQFRSSQFHLRSILHSALFIVFIISLIVSVLSFVFNKLPGIAMDNQMLQKGLIYSIPGLIFFSQNKTLTAYLNGVRRMKEYAVFTFARPMLMLMFVIFVIEKSYDVIYLSLAFFVPELILFFVINIYLIRLYTKFDFNRSRKIVGLHLRFGNRAAFGNIVLDLYSKLDVLMLGFFLSNTLVGVYSFAAFVTDGFVQIFYVFRTNINPIITELHFHRSKELFQRIVGRFVQKFYWILSTLGLVCIIGYPAILYVSDISQYYSENLIVFVILIGGAIAASGYIPFQMIFNQVGMPYMQTKFLVSGFLINGFLNLLLIPIIGIYGAAIAIFISYFFQIGFIKYYSFKLLQIKI